MSATTESFEFVGLELIVLEQVYGTPRRGEMVIVAKTGHGEEMHFVVDDNKADIYLEGYRHMDRSVPSCPNYGPAATLEHTTRVAIRDRHYQDSIAVRFDAAASILTVGALIPTGKDTNELRVICSVPAIMHCDTGTQKLES